MRKIINVFLLGIVSILSGCATTPPSYFYSPQYKHAAEKLGTSDKAEIRKRFGDYADLVGHAWVDSTSSYNLDSPIWKVYIPEWQVKGSVLMLHEHYFWEDGAESAQDHYLEYDPTVGGLKYFFFANQVASSVSKEDYKNKVGLKGTGIVNSDGSVKWSGFLFNETHRFDKESDTYTRGNNIFTKLDRLTYVVEMRERMALARRTAQSDRNENSELFAAAMSGFQTGMYEAQEQRAYEDYQQQVFLDGINVQVREQERLKSLAHKQSDKSGNPNSLSTRNERSNSSSTSQTATRKLTASKNVMPNKEVSSKSNLKHTTKKDESVSKSHSSSEVLVLPSGIQQNSWSSWYPLTSAGGAKLKYRVYLGKDESRFQWQINNSNPHPIYASVNDKKYIQAGGSIKSGPSEATSIKANGTYTFVSDQVSGNGYMKIGARFVVKEQ